MKTITILSLTGVCALPAATVVDVNGASFTLSGTPTTLNGSLADMPVGAPEVNKWESVAIVGSTLVGTTAATPAATIADRDYFLQFNGAGTGEALDGITVSDNRYVQINYTLTGGWTGTTNQLRLNSTGPGAAAFVSFAGSATIPQSDGSHSIIIDLTDGGTDFSGEWSVVRWDFFNDLGNGGGKTFTLESAVFSDSITAIPEPSAALLGGLGLLALLRRRQH